MLHCLVKFVNDTILKLIKKKRYLEHPQIKNRLNVCKQIRNVYQTQSLNATLSLRKIYNNNNNNSINNNNNNNNNNNDNNNNSNNDNNNNNNNNNNIFIQRWSYTVAKFLL